jgi:hypothetical protein
MLDDEIFAVRKSHHQAFKKKIPAEGGDKKKAGV